MGSDDISPATAAKRGNDDGDRDDEPEAKKAKTVAAQRNEQGETFFLLSKKRRVTVRTYNNKALIDVREVSNITSCCCLLLAMNDLSFLIALFTSLDTQKKQCYGDNDDKPGKKGISLPVDQYEKLKELIVGGEIDDALQKLESNK